MQKRWLIIGVILVVLFFIGAFFYTSLATPTFSAGKGSISNPAEDLSIDEVRQQFNEDFVYYMLYSIKAYQLHNIPLTSNEPRIEILVGDTPYSAIIRDGNIFVDKTGLDNPDIRIVTTLDEAAEMVKYPVYVQKSFAEGKSSINLIAGKTELFSKGYLNLYTQVTGKSITGNVIRIYTE